MRHAELSPTELSLDDMLADLIVQQLMRRDGVSEHDVREVMSHAGRRRRTEPNASDARDAA